jgi:hypothetical protein
VWPGERKIMSFDDRAASPIDPICACTNISAIHQTRETGEGIVGLGVFHVGSNAYGFGPCGDVTDFYFHPAEKRGGPLELRPPDVNFPDQRSPYRAAR